MLQHYCPISSGVMTDLDAAVEDLNQQDLKTLCGRLVSAHISHDKVSIGQLVIIE